MKAYIMPPDVPSHAVTRVMEALARHAPRYPQRHVDIVSNINDADLVVLNVIGRQDKIRALTEKLTQQRKRYAVIQYCLKSTLRPHTQGWLPIWIDAEVVWSYLDLQAAIHDDRASRVPWNFYHAPLGVDNKVFFSQSLRTDRPYIICTSGQSYLTESVRECILAARRAGRAIIHLGPELNMSGVTCLSGLDDRTLAKMYRQCEFVSGLRRKEGFELPAAEGLVCGARPILFDQPHYRAWYKPWAEFVPEGTRGEVIDALEGLFRAGARPVEKSERDAAKQRFDWKVIVKGFWKRC